MTCRTRLLNSMHADITLQERRTLGRRCGLAKEMDRNTPSLFMPAIPGGTATLFAETTRHSTCLAQLSAQRLHHMISLVFDEQGWSQHDRARKQRNVVSSVVAVVCYSGSGSGSSVHARKPREQRSTPLAGHYDIPPIWHNLARNVFVTAYTVQSTP
ncbi:hypothetical protein BDW22DRAFT_979584 [Trametopsis cervina]|nr:hypothetical protein BDW22DRAFT_979584 [Trametopsis cervina]